VDQRFAELFVGGPQAHGVWDPETGDAKTLKEPASVKDYEAHLSGAMGLGLCPVNTEGTCRFAAIDIDVDTIDHVQLHQRITVRKMPLHVCRSKSGGAHLYLFMKEPMKSNTVISVLKRWAGVLGYPSSEVFPKQARASKQNLGNWLNLPYFDEARTVRYCVALRDGVVRALSLDEFLSSITYWDGKDQSEKIKEDAAEGDLIQIGQMPPCLAALTQEGLPAGHRNQGMFNFAVFYRKSSPNGWEDKVSQHNQNYVQPPLSYREVQTVIKSVGNRTYQYVCDQEPICSRCDRKTCLTLPFGVGNEPWKDDIAYTELLISHCRKIKTDPPRWIVEVNGHDIELSTDQLMNFQLFQKRVYERFSVLGPPRKKEYWDKTLIELAERTTEIEAPKDASEQGMMLDKVLDFLALHERAKDREDLLKGIPVEYKNAIAFRVSDLQKYMHSQRIMNAPNEVLYQLLYSEGCRSTSMRVSGKVVSVWLFPKEKLNLQTDEFVPPNLDNTVNEI
jgi:hypothetical protein